jgi:NAD(P)-dependent dehydrogenase (short-subunit alcohol dehydrogenase family)
MGDTDFAGRTAVITGGTSGVGRDTALLLARTGAQVVITGRDVERGHAVVDEITGVGGAGRFVRADLTNCADVRELADQVGPVDMLVNNAGYWEIGPTAQTTETGFDAMFAINVKGPFFLTAVFAPAMAARGHGAIVNVSTMVAVRGAAGMAAYGASKAALESLTRSWAAEFGPAGVRVNAVALGPTHTHRAPRRRPTCSRPWLLPAHYDGLTSPATSPKPSTICSATPQPPSPAPCCPLTADVSQRSDSHSQRPRDNFET